MNCFNSCGYRFVKSLIYIIILSNFFEVNAQFNEDIFNKVSIEIDGEDIFNIYEITQDHQGYIWMATNLGLIRYNGIEGKKYEIKRDNSYSIANDDIWFLYVDDLGDLWIGANSGLYKYNPDCDCLHQFPSKIDDINLTDIRSITEDKNKNIWIGTKNSGLLRYVREKESFTRVLHEPSDLLTIANDRIYHLLVDQNNNLWIGTASVNPIAGSGLVRYNIQSGNVKQFSYDPSDPNSLIDKRISALYENQKGQILIGTYKSGFHIYDPKTDLLNRISFDANNPTHIHAPYTEEKVFGNDPKVNLIHQDQKGDYWIGTTGMGINYFNTNNKTINNYTFNLVNPQNLWSLLEDNQGNIWIGSIMGGGLYRTDLFARKYHLNTNFSNVEAAYESPLNPGIIWVKSQQTALSKMDLKTGKIINYLHDENNVNSIGHNWVRSIFQEDGNTLWVGLGNGGPYGGHDGNGGIDRMDIEKETFTHYRLTRDDDGLDDFSYTVYSICKDHEGYLWAGAGPGGIFRSDKSKTAFKHFKISKSDSSSGEVFLNVARIDSNGDIWASDFADEGTLYLYDQQGETFNPFLKGFKMYNLLVDNKGWLLISTYEKGLVHFNPADRTYVQYTKKDGLPSNDAVDIVAGENSIYWVNTRMGPAKFDTETGIIYPVGLPKYRYNIGIFRASDNQIYLGTNNGLSSFYPDQVLGNPYPPQIVISELLISDTNHVTGKSNQNELSFSYDQNDIAIKYIGLHFSNPKKNSYQYKLDPLDKNWINTGHERTVRFANLSPGTYNFQVKAANSDSVWSEEAASLQFTIHPAWWASWWAYLIYLAIAVAFADRFYRFQLSRKMAVSESIRLKEVNQLKNTLFTNITHEFRTPLTVIKGMTGSIQSGIQKKKFDEVENSLEMIDRNSDGLLQLVNEMLDLAKIESGNMKLQLVQTDVIPFLKYLSESFSSLAEQNQISLTIYSEIDSLIMDFDGHKLNSVISNLLSNAIKFTPAFGKVIVHIKQITQNGENFLFVKIKDNGVGISSKELPDIFDRFFQSDASTIRKSGGTGIGLALTKELVDLMNGTIEAKSIINEGSEFSVSIPVTKKAPTSKDVKIDGVLPASIYKKPSVHTNRYAESTSELPLALIIEDNKDVAHYLKTCLQENYQVIHAQNGAIGIQTAYEKVPDIIISDVMMPVKDGFEVCNTLKTDELTDHIPIVMLTAKATFEDRLTGLSHGADAYLTKPFEKAELLIRIDQLILLRKKMLSKFEKTGLDQLLNRNVKKTETQFLQKIITLIDDNMTNGDFGSEQLALGMHLSESQIYRKLKAVTDKSTAVFIRSIRLQKGKELIQTTNRTISEIAYDVGFNDPSWFSKAFKEEFGFAPSTLSK